MPTDAYVSFARTADDIDGAAEHRNETTEGKVLRPKVVFQFLNEACDGLLPRLEKAAV